MALSHLSCSLGKKVLLAHFINGISEALRGHGLPESKTSGKQGWETRYELP